MREHYVVELDGTFDLDAAERVRGMVSTVPDRSAVTLDFSRVRWLHDAALAVLVPALARPDGPQVDARGLGQHHRRLWRYLGLSLPPDAPQADTEAAGS